MLTFWICSASDGPRAAPHVGRFATALPGRVTAPLSLAACSNIFRRAANDMNYSPAPFLYRCEPGTGSSASLHSTSPAAPVRRPSVQPRSLHAGCREADVRPQPAYGNAIHCALACPDAQQALASGPLPIFPASSTAFPACRRCNLQ